MSRLNLGCGNDYLPGFVNLDRGDCKTDVCWDMEVFPYPFEDNTFEYVLSQHVLEHISKESFPYLVRELHRICKNGAIIEVLVPAPLSENYFSDFTHKHPMGLRVFDYFDDSKSLRENGLIYGFGDVTLRVLRACDLTNEPNGPDRFFQLEIVK